MERLLKPPVVVSIVSLVVEQSVLVIDSEHCVCVCVCGEEVIKVWKCMSVYTCSRYHGWA